MAAGGGASSFGRGVALDGGSAREQRMGLLSKLKEGSFSRGQELEADRFGLELVQKHFGHVAGSWRFFKKIGVYKYLDSFPYIKIPRFLFYLYKISSNHLL